MPQASLVMFAMISRVQCTIRSLVLNAPTHLQKSLESVGFIATPRCARSVKLSTGYFQEIPRDFSVRLLESPTLLRCRTAKLSGAWPKMKSHGISRKKSVGSLGNIPRPTSRLQCRQRLLLAQWQSRFFRMRRAYCPWCRALPSTEAAMEIFLGKCVLL